MYYIRYRKNVNRNNVKKVLKEKLIALLCISNFGLVYAQQNPLFSNDIYSGISTATTSPTQTFINPNPWDIQLFSTDISVLNDYAYISKMSLIGLTGTTIETANPKKGILGSTKAGVMDFYNKDFANLQFSSDIMGPSFSLRTHIGDQQFNIGLFSRLRTQGTVKDFDNYLRFQNQDIARPDNYFLKPFDSNFMNWGELGLNFSTKIFKQSDYDWLLGFNLKYEVGFDAFNIRNLDNLHLTARLDDDGESIASAEQYNIAASYATNYNFDQKKYDFKQQGKGLGLDFGLSFINKFPDNEGYDFKASFNVLDIGYVDFKQGINHRFIGNKKIDLEQNPAFDDMEFTSAEEFLQTLSQEVYGSASASLATPGFRIGLPTSINLSLSKNLKDHHYLNFNWSQRAPIFENSLKKMNAMTVSYSVQNRAIAYGFSSSLYEYQNLQFGAYARLGPFIIGSENILPMVFNHQKLHAANIFIGLKLYPFWDDDFKRHRREKCNCD